MSNESAPRGGIHLSSGFGTAATLSPREIAPAPRFDLLVVGDFGGSGRDRLTDISDKDIAEALSNHGAVIALEVENHLGSEPPVLALRIPVAALRDFERRTIAPRTPEIAKAQEIAAAFAKTGALDAEARSPRFDKLVATLARQDQSAPASAPTASDDGSLDDLLAMVDIAPPPPAAGDANRALSAFIASTSRRDAAAAPAPAKLDPVERQIDAVAVHPAWLAAEATWRSLRLILAQRRRGAPLRIRLWDVAGDTLAASLESDAFIEALTRDADEAHWGALLVLGALGSSARDLAALRRLALIGYARQTPVIVSLRPDFFGAPPESVAAMDNPAALLEGPAHGAWRGLRQRPESEFLFAAWNDVVLRAREDQIASLWGEAGGVVAAQIVASLARTGWPTELVGGGTAIEGLDVALVAGRAGRTAAAPLRALVDPAIARDLAGAGLICLVARADRDQAWLVRAASVHQHGGVTSENREMIEAFAGLSFRFVSTLLETTCRALVEDMPRGLSDSDAAALLERGLGDLLQSSGAGARVAVTPRPREGDAARAFEVEVALGRDIMGGFGFAFDLDA